MAVRKIASQFVNPRTVHIFVGDGAGVEGKLVRKCYMLYVSCEMKKDFYVRALCSVRAFL